MDWRMAIAGFEANFGSIFVYIHRRWGPPGRYFTRGVWGRNAGNAWRGDPVVGAPWGRPEKSRLISMNCIFCRSRDPQFWHPVCALSSIIIFWHDFFEKVKKWNTRRKSWVWGGSLISPVSGYFAAAVYGLLVYPRLTISICGHGLTKRETVVNFFIILCTSWTFLLIWAPNPHRLHFQNHVLQRDEALKRGWVNPPHPQIQTMIYFFSATSQLRYPKGGEGEGGDER